MLFLQSFNIVWGEGGGKGKATQFETENSAFVKLCLKRQKINVITQVSQGILSTIVGQFDVTVRLICI